MATLSRSSHLLLYYLRPNAAILERWIDIELFNEEVVRLPCNGNTSRRLAVQLDDRV